MDDAVFAIDLVGSSRDDLPWGLLAQDISLACTRGDLIGRVGLTEAELGGVSSAQSHNSRVDI